MQLITRKSREQLKKNDITCLSDSNYVLLLSPLHLTFHLPLYNLCFTIALGRFPFAYLVTHGEKEENKKGNVFFYIYYTLILKCNIRVIYEFDFTFKN